MKFDLKKILLLEKILYSKNIRILAPYKSNILDVPLLIIANKNGDGYGNTTPSPSPYESNIIEKKNVVLIETLKKYLEDEDEDEYSHELKDEIEYIFEGPDSLTFINSGDYSKYYSFDDEYGIIIPKNTSIISQEFELQHTERKYNYSIIELIELLSKLSLDRSYGY